MPFFDAGGDGSYDSGAGEYGVTGVTLALLDSAGNVIATTVTDENGKYEFPALPASNDYTAWVNSSANVLGELSQTADPGAAYCSRSTITNLSGNNTVKER